MSDEQTLSEMFGGEWKEHPKAPSYFFSNLGLAARKSTRFGRLEYRQLRGILCGQHGYRAITPSIGNKLLPRLYIHRAVCELFNGEQPNGKLHCRHLDGDQFNNKATNLAWGTPKENAMDGVRNGKIKRGTDNHMAKLNPEAVRLMKEIREKTGAFYHDIAEQFGVSRMTAHRAINGVLWNV
jgi:hypothetical protein